MKTTNLASFLQQLIFLYLCLGNLASAVATPPFWVLPEIRENVIRGRVRDLAAGEGVVVAVTETVSAPGNAGLMYVSEDGREWTDLAQLTDFVPMGEAIAYGNGVFVLSSGFHAYLSSDGIHWQPLELDDSIVGGTSQNNLYFTNVKFFYGFFYALSSEQHLLKSENGRDWISIHIPFQIHHFVQHGPSGKWFATTYQSEYKLYESGDGLSWELIRDGQYEIKSVGNAVVIAKQEEIPGQGIQVASTEYTVDGTNWIKSDEYLIGMDYRNGITNWYHLFVSGGDFIRTHFTYEDGVPICYVHKSKMLGNWTEVARYHSQVNSAPVLLENNAITVGFIEDISFWSADNQTWEHHWESPYPENEIFSFIRYSSQRGKDPVFLGALNQYPGGCDIRVSKDGFQWESVWQLDRSVLDMGYLPDADQFFLIRENAVDAGNTVQIDLTTHGSDWTVLNGAVEFTPQSIVQNGSTWLIFGGKSGELLVSQDDGATWSAEIKGIEWNTPTSSSGVFEDAYLLVESVGEKFVIIWDTTVYWSDDGINWTKALDVTDQGEWFTFLDRFNGHFIATARTQYSNGRFLIPRWDGYDYALKLYVSEDGQTWDVIDASDVTEWEHLTRRNHYRESDLRRKLGENCGEYFYACSGDHHIMIDKDFNLSLVPRINTEYYLLPLQGKFTFGKGRIFDIAKNPSSSPGPLAHSSFVGFADFLMDSQGRKETNWLGTYDDTQYPILDHELWGDVYFDPKENGSDGFTLYSENAGILSSTRGTVPEFFNELDGNTYRVNFDSVNSARYTNTETGEVMDHMPSESASKQTWLLLLDDFLANAQHEAILAIICSQEKDQLHAAMHLKTLREIENKANKYGDLLLNKYAGHAGIEDHVANKLQAIETVKTMVLEQMEL